MILTKTQSLLLGEGYNQLIESDILLLDISNVTQYVWTKEFDLLTPSSLVPSQSETLVLPSPTHSGDQFSEQQSDKSNKTTIIGVVIGSLFGGALLSSFGSFFLYRWNKNRQKQIYNRGQKIVQPLRNENTTNHEPRSV